MRDPVHMLVLSSALIAKIALASPADALNFGDVVDVPVNQNSLATAFADPGDVAVHQVARMVADLMDAMDRKDYALLRKLYIPNAQAVYFSGGENWINFVDTGPGQETAN